MRRIRFLVVGRVQGVGFRAHAQAEARRLGLVGFVRNRRDGGVEGEAQGPAADVAAFAAWLHRGPSWAEVARADVEELAADGRDPDFAIRR